MHRLVRFYNQNRRQIWEYIIIIVSAILLLQVLNNFVKMNKKNDKKEENIQEKNHYDTSLYEPNKSAISGKTVSQKVYTKQSNLIDNFIENCNNGKIQEAYNLLSNACKDALYPTVKDFELYYYNLMFKEKRIYSLENWTGSIYRVNMTEDLLATGKSNEGEVIQDYITIVQEDGESKLNINKFVGTKNLNKEKKEEKLSIKVIKSEQYVDYEIYEIQVKNTSEHKIMLANIDNLDEIYLKDSNNQVHEVYKNEISSTDLILPSNTTKTLKIKFTNPYISTRKIEALIFSNVYYEYKIDDPYNANAKGVEKFNIKINL